MLLVDVNFLVALHFAGHAHHHAASSCLEEMCSNEKSLGLCDFAMTGFVRVATSRHILSSPSTLEKALGFVGEVLEYPRSIRVSPGEGHWRIFCTLCRESRAAGPFISDVYLAALAQEHGATLVSFDSDFARFPGLRWHNPLKA